MINKIKDKLKRTWNWTKEKAKKFKKWIIALLIPVALAAPLAIPRDTIVIYKDAKELGQQERMENYIVSERNFDRIQYEELRRQIDWKYNEAHDTLSQAYYEGKEFMWNGRNYGILSKESFDELQGMIWARYEVLFHQENLKQGLYPESDYNEVRDKDGKLEYKKSDKALEKIQKLQDRGIDIDL